MDHNPYSALSRLCYKYSCSSCDIQRVLGIMAEELEQIKEEVERKEGDDKTKDYEEPKEDGLNNIITLVEAYNNYDSERYPKEVVEKLKAWKRLKDKGFRFTGWDTNEGIRGVDFEVPDSSFSEHNHSCISDETKDDLDLLFWSEE